MKKHDAYWIGFIVLVVIFFLVELNGLNHVDPGDEWVYFYMAKEVSSGSMPYKDFFFAHPPIQLVVLSITFLIFGFNLVALKLVPLLAVIGSSVFLFLIAKKQLGYKAAIVSCLLYMFSYRVLAEATYALGINLTVLFVMIGLWLVVNKGKYLIGGAIFGIAAMTGLYSAPIIVGVSAMVFLRSKKNFMKIVYGFVMSFATINVIFLLTAGSDYILGTYTYHFLKPAIEKSSGVFLEVIWKNLFIFSMAAIGLLYSLKKKLMLFTVAAILHILFLTIFLNTIFNFYFLLAFPFMAIIAANGVVTLHNKYKKKAMIVVIILTVTFAWHSYNNVYKLNSFDFVDFQSTSSLVDAVGNNKVIFGDDSTVPMVALYTGSTIWNDFIDTNDLVFRAGIEDINVLIESIKADSPDVILIRPLTGIGNIEEFQSFLFNECSQKGWIKDTYFGDLILFKCN